MLKNRADIRTVAYLLIAAALLAVQWNLSSFNPLLYLWALFMAVAVSAIAHNHNHLQIWRSKALNALTDYWITVFYGFPVFAWIPTHNQNHHKFNNRAGDDTLTYRHSEKNNLVTLLTYPSVSSAYQMPAIRRYLEKLWRKNRPRFWYSVSQGVVLGAFILGALLIDWRKAIVFVILPQQVSMFSVLVLNYLQHVHADEESEYNHSRNFVGWLANALLFNAGYHFVHHEKPGMHWSEAAEAHKEVADRIDPVLQQRSFWGFMIGTYLLGPFIPALRSRSLRLERLAKSQ
jgi:fatty acid desaturase